jgi:hypothetical protein
MKVTYYVVSSGPRPPFAEVAKELWGSADFDSDGNSSGPSDTKWTELTVILRPTYAQRVDIDPVSDDPLVLKVESASAELAERAARFIALCSEGTLTTQWPG